MRFVADMKAGGFRLLFEDKPVLLRLIAGITRQWIDTSREFVLRLDADLPAIRAISCKSGATSRVAKIEGGLSDPHNDGRSVQIVAFEDGARVVYKPKDLRLDVAWHDLVERLNRADPPIALQAVRAIARDGYGWTEFIDHTGCADDAGLRALFPARRRLARAAALFRRDRHASGEHDRGRRAPGADRSGNDPAAERRGAQSPRCRERGLRCRARNRRQLGDDGRACCRPMDAPSTTTMSSPWAA